MMMRWCLVLAFGLAWIPPALGQEKPRRREDVKGVLEKKRSFVTMDLVGVAGAAPVQAKLMVDTGSTQTLIKREIWEKLKSGHPLRRMRTPGTGESALGELLVGDLASLGIGRLVQSPFTVGLVPDSQKIDGDGVLGIDFLNNYYFSLTPVAVAAGEPSACILGLEELGDTQESWTLVMFCERPEEWPKDEPGMWEKVETRIRDQLKDKGIDQVRIDQAVADPASFADLLFELPQLNAITASSPHWARSYHWHFDVVSTPFRRITFPDYGFTIDAGAAIVTPRSRSPQYLSGQAIASTWHVQVPGAPSFRKGEIETHVQLESADGTAEQTVMVVPRLDPEMLKYVALRKLLLTFKDPSYKTKVPGLFESGEQAAIKLSRAKEPILFLPIRYRDIVQQVVPAIFLASMGGGPYYHAATDASKLNASNRLDRSPTAWAECMSVKQNIYEETVPAESREQGTSYWQALLPPTDSRKNRLVIGETEMGYDLRLYVYDAARNGFKRQNLEKADKEWVKSLWDKATGRNRAE